MRNRQQGLSLIGLIIVGGLLAFVLLVGFRSVPAFTEYFAIQQVIRAVAEEGDSGASMTELRRSFDRRSGIDNISTITSKDLDIFKQGGKVVIEVEYERKVPIAGNVSLLFDFSASTANR